MSTFYIKIRLLAFKEANNEVKDKLDIVFVSCDEDEEAFNDHFKEMPWKVLSFSSILKYFIFN